MAVAQRGPWGLKPDFEKMPRVLRKATRWVTWKARIKPDGSVGKQPYQANGKPASVVNPTDWCTYDEAVAAYRADPSLSGIGFVLTKSTRPVTCLDLDKCLDADGKLSAHAHAIVEAADSYTELSPSGKGVRIILMGDAGAFIVPGTECYTQESKRFVTITGHRIANSGDVGPVNEALLGILDEIRPRKGDQETVDKIRENKEQIRKILLQMDSSEWEGYEKWLELGMAIHHQFDGDDDGLDLWDELSQQLVNYEQDELIKKWDSFGGGGGKPVTLRTFLKEAKEQGVNIKPVANPEDFPDLDEDPPEASDKPPKPGSEDPKPGRPAWLMGGVEMLGTPPPMQIVEELFAMKQVSMITGAPGAGKSFLGLHAGYCVSRGDDFFGRRVRQGNVVYLAYEGVAALQQRARAIESVQGKAWPRGMVCGSPPVSMSTEGWGKTLGDDLVSFKPKLIVVDTLAAALPGMSTSDEGIMGKLMSELRAWAVKWNCHIMVIHHPPKGGGTTGLQLVRGSGVIEGDLDTLLFVQKDTRTGLVTATVAKQRSLGSFGEEFIYKLQSCRTGMETQWGLEKAAYLSEEVTPEDKLDPTIESLRIMVRQAIQDAGGVGIDKGEWLTIKERWIATEDRLSGLAEDTIKERQRNAVRQMSDEFKFIRGGNQQISRVETLM